MTNQLLLAGAIAGIIEAIFWIGVGVYFIRRKMMKRKAEPKSYRLPSDHPYANLAMRRVSDYRKSALNEAIHNEYYAIVGEEE